jgi:hypothetical protein
LFFRLSVLYGGSQVKRDRKLVFPWYLKILKGNKYFELMEAVKSPEVIRVYRNRNFPLIYPTGLANKGFILLLIFSFALILSGLGALLDVFLGRRSHDNVDNF